MKNNYYKPTKPEPKPIPIHKRSISGDDVINFETVDDFNEFYNANPELFDEKHSTNILNRKYKIDGFRITRRTNKETNTMETKLMKTKTKKDDKIENKLQDLENIINTQTQNQEDLKNKINTLSERFTKLIEKLVNEEII